MVWAVSMPSDFGPFFPGGDFPDFRERLEAYRSNDMPDAEREALRGRSSYSRWVFQKFTHEIGVKRSGGPVLTPLRDHEWPQEFQARRPIKNLGVVFKAINRVLAVNEQMKDLIERIEPGVHQFRPLTVLQPDSTPFPGSYFTMVIGQFRDAFQPEDTEQKLWREVSYTDNNNQTVITGLYTCLAVGEESYARLAFSRRVIGDAHLWRDSRLLGPDYYISDVLRDEIKRAKLRIPRPLRVKEVA